MVRVPAPERFWQLIFYVHVYENSQRYSFCCHERGRRLDLQVFSVRSDLGLLQGRSHRFQQNCNVYF